MKASYAKRTPRNEHRETNIARLIVRTGVDIRPGRDAVSEVNRIRRCVLLTDVLPLKNEIYEDSDTEESESESDFLHALWKAKENVLKNQDASFREVPLSSNVERSS